MLIFDPGALQPRHHERVIGLKQARRRTRSGFLRQKCTYFASEAGRRCSSSPCQALPQKMHFKIAKAPQETRWFEAGKPPKTFWPLWSSWELGIRGSLAAHPNLYLVYFSFFINPFNSIPHSLLPRLFFSFDL